MSALPPKADMAVQKGMSPMVKSRQSTRRQSPGLPRGSMARATRSQLELDLPLMLKSVYPMGESSGANNRTCVLCFDLAVLLADWAFRPSLNIQRLSIHHF